MRRNFWYLVITVVLIVGCVRREPSCRTTGRCSASTCRAGSPWCSRPSARCSNEASLNKAVDIIRNRVDALGVAEPEISRQGRHVIIDLPGVRDRDKARRLVGKTAELRFRPVLAILPAGHRRDDRHEEEGDVEDHRGRRRDVLEHRGDHDDDQPCEPEDVDARRGQRGRDGRAPGSRDRTRPRSATSSVRPHSPARA